MKQIKILGTGCAKCEMLTRHAHEAANALGIDYELTKVTDLAEIMSFGVMTTPALVVDGKVIVSGRVPTAEAIEAMLRQTAVIQS
jgi:small redox-active disulfide protein 2